MFQETDMDKLIIAAFLLLISTSVVFAGGHSPKSSLYLVRAKLSTEAFKGFVNNPQDREAPVRKLFGAVGVKFQNLYFSVSTREVVVLAESTAEDMAAVQMVTSAAGTTIGFEALELIDAKSMTAAMEKANQTMSTYRAPNK